MTNNIKKSNVIKFQRIVLDKKTAFLCPLEASYYLTCGDKNGTTMIPEKSIKGMTVERAWDILYQLIYEK